MVDLEEQCAVEQEAAEAQLLPHVLLEQPALEALVVCRPLVEACLEEVLNPLGDLAVEAVAELPLALREQLVVEVLWQPVLPQLPGGLLLLSSQYPPLVKPSRSAHSHRAPSKTYASPIS